MKAFFDANVLISAAAFGGVPKALVDLAIEFRFELFLDHHVLAGLEAKLVAKIGTTRTEAHELRSALEALATVVDGGHIEAVVRDPDDDHVLAAAMQAGVDVIVTGDKDLLVLGTYRGIEILTPREFLDRLEA